MPPFCPFSARVRAQENKSSTSFSEILDRSAEMLFMTEIFRGFWLTAEVIMKPKVTINYVSASLVAPRPPIAFPTTPRGALRYDSSSCSTLIYFRALSSSFSPSRRHTKTINNNNVRDLNRLRCPRAAVREGTTEPPLPR